LGVIAEMAKRVVVMYSGKVVEEGSIDDIFFHPQHPYTEGLLETIPRIDQNIQPGKRLSEIPGMIPSLRELPRGCYFHPRCSRVMEVCRQEAPELKKIGDQHLCSCWLI